MPNYMKMPQGKLTACIKIKDYLANGEFRSETRVIPQTSNKKKTTIAGNPNAELLRKTRV